MFEFIHQEIPLYYLLILAAVTLMAVIYVIHFFVQSKSWEDKYNLGGRKYIEELEKKNKTIEFLRIDNKNSEDAHYKTRVEFDDYKAKTQYVHKSNHAKDERITVLERLLRLHKEQLEQYQQDAHEKGVVWACS